MHALCGTHPCPRYLQEQLEVLMDYQAPRQSLEYPGAHGDQRELALENNPNSGQAIEHHPTFYPWNIAHHRHYATPGFNSTGRCKKKLKV